MNNRTGEQVRAVLTAIDDITPEPPPLPTSPTQQPRRQSSLVAAGAFIAVLIVIGVGLLVLRPSAIDNGEVIAGPGTPQGPPHLVLELPDTRIIDAYNIFDESTGVPVGIHTTYHMTLTDDPDGWLGRELLLRVQQPGAAFGEFDHWVPLAKSTSTVIVGGREVTVYEIPDEAIAEGNYDLGILRWAETPGYEVILIPWGIGPDEAITLMDGLKVVSDSEWDQLTKSAPDTSEITIPSGTDELISLFPRFVINLPGFEIVGGNEAWYPPAAAGGDWQFRIGETKGNITLSSDHTTPSQIFVDDDTLEEVRIDGFPGVVMTGLLVRYDGGFFVEWVGLDTRFTVFIDGTDIDPLTLIEAIGEVDEATWRQLLPETTP
ncbi:MAG: hypothetical protein IH941_05385 [Acidobacteria bacterium]|nr:hypothetical protein [Acidobacteriota bacterium]